LEGEKKKEKHSKREDLLDGSNRLDERVEGIRGTDDKRRSGIDNRRTVIREALVNRFA